MGIYIFPYIIFLFQNKKLKDCAITCMTHLSVLYMFFVYFKSTTYFNNTDSLQIRGLSCFCHGLGLNLLWAVIDFSISGCYLTYVLKP